MSTVPTSETGSSSAPVIRYLQVSDLIHPSELGEKTLGRDYCLLAHYSDAENIKKIRAEGLKSAWRLSKDPDTSEELKRVYRNRSMDTRFGNDPRLIYSCPRSPHQLRPTSRYVLMAAPVTTLFVFNQEARANLRTEDSRQVSHNKYLSSGMLLSVYLNRLSGLRQGQHLSTFGYPSYGDSGVYLPEAIIDADLVPTDLLLPEGFHPWKTELGRESSDAES